MAVACDVSASAARVCDCWSSDLSLLVVGTSALAEAVALELGSAGPLVVLEVPLKSLGGFSDLEEKTFFQKLFFGSGRCGGCGLACASLVALVVVVEGLLMTPLIDGFIVKSDIVDTIFQRSIFWEYQVMYCLMLMSWHTK
jgi:hypothetical protein